MNIILFSEGIGKEVLLLIFGEEQAFPSERFPDQSLISRGYIQGIVGIETGSRLFFEFDNLQFVVNIE
jgi:hypothetical protein